MISRITGTLVTVGEGDVELRAGPVHIAALVPASDVEALRLRIGSELDLFTLCYLEGDPNRGNLEPRLIGFVRADDRAFFELFTTVKGIGPKTALRALAEPIGAIAGWIESKDARSLTKLNGIGKRTAELIVAELSGKCGKYALNVTIPAERRSIAPARRDPLSEDAIGALVALGERRSDAEMLLDRARSTRDGLDTVNALVTEMLRLRGS
jgi:holliday junction DNA helicase RuvA